MNQLLSLIAPSVNPRRPVRRASRTWVNDVHSHSNHTGVRMVLTPRSQDEIGGIVQFAARDGVSICVSGSRHAMGGQQFATDAILIDTRRLCRVLSFDPERGLVEVEAGMQWPELIAACLAAQPGCKNPWTIAQKQTGADAFTIGGSLSANIHGRGLTMKPLVGDVEAFTLLDASGRSVKCSRSQSPELFALAIGGYGLFGVITRVTLRLVRRRRLERLVEVIRTEALMARFEDRIREGCLYGDFQFAIDEKSEDFLQLGVLSIYRPVEDRAEITAPRQLSEAQWVELLHLAYTDRSEGFRRYAAHYLATHEQTYWSDEHQLSPYLADYRARMRELTGSTEQSSLMISELYVPREALAGFLRAAAALLRGSGVPVIYGTVRLIEADHETFLAWARKPYACIIFNLLMTHNPAGMVRSAETFRGLIELATTCGGSFYLTYHRYASRMQVERCYPQFAEWLARKEALDPAGRFQSDWHRHYWREFNEPR